MGAIGLAVATAATILVAVLLEGKRREAERAHVQEARQRQRFAQQVEALTGGSSGRFLGADLLAVAAMMLIGASLLLPVLNRMRADARQAACAGNLAVAGTAFGRYATDHGHTLPRGKVRPGTVRWSVGQPEQPEGLVQSNSAHRTREWGGR